MADYAKKIVSISDDKTLRVWDVQTNAEISSMKFATTPSSLELSKDGEWLVLAHGTFVDIYESSSLEKLYSFDIKKPVSAASIHPNKSVFVCSDENFTLYKYSVNNGVELGKLLNSLVSPKPCTKA